MLNRDELLSSPDFLLTSYQNDIYNLLVDYMTKKGVSKGDIAQKLNVSAAYVSQILNGNFNFTLKKIIELSLAVDKIPSIEFLSKADYWNKVDRKRKRISVNIFTDRLMVKVAEKFYAPTKKTHAQAIGTSKLHLIEEFS